MPGRTRYTHAVLAQQPALLIKTAVVCGDHTSFAGGDKLAGMEAEAGDIAMRPADVFPCLPGIQRYGASNCASGIFNDGKTEALCRLPDS